MSNPEIPFKFSFIPHSKLLCFVLVLLVQGMHSGMLNAQQADDPDFSPKIAAPMYARGQGTIICIDEGHHNFHTKDGRYAPFARLLEQDGYRVEHYRGLFEKDKLEDCGILVISNALHESSLGNWGLPTESAFTEEEIEHVQSWVADGGSLFLIADHMPMAGAAEALALPFGFSFTNGFAMDTTTRGPALFSLENGTLGDCILTRGRNDSERVTRVASFTGQAFDAFGNVDPVLTFGPHFINMLPDTAWVFNEGTRRHPVEGWFQLAFKTYGSGKIVVSGEAAMFTAQLAGPQKLKMGMNHPEAKENDQLLLNIIHWLDGKLQ